MPAVPLSPRLGFLRDFAEEHWPSMDLCGEMLFEHLQRDYRDRLTLVDLRPPFRRRWQRLPWVGRRRAAFNTDRLLNRLWDYPRHVHRHRSDADVFHLVDHSYAQILAELPAGRAGLYCHDLDTFRCLLTPREEPRPRWFRAMARRILNGFQRAAVVFHSTETVREQIVRHQLIDPAKLIQAPLGFAPEFRPDPPADAAAEAILQPIGGHPYVLHVGSCIPRKRIDVLLKLFARLRDRMRDLRLIKVGGEWTAEHRQLIERHQFADAVIHVSGIPRTTLAQLYRRAALVLMPSDAEGFGIPVLEALACGARVLASDLPVFRGVAGSAARYAPAGDVEAFVQAAAMWLQEGDQPGDTAARVTQANLFSWQRHAQIIGDAYLRLGQA
jgi:glycosyltransferase involved in cell wall biosynthesis